MKRLVILEEYCKSCGNCVEVCPKGALRISDRMNTNSYCVAEVDQEKCICCGTCYLVCPDYVFEIVEE